VQQAAFAFAERMQAVLGDLGQEGIEEVLLGRRFAFARLLGADWAAFLPVLLAGSIGQWTRAKLRARGVNLCLIAVAIAFMAGVIGGIGAHFLGSASAETALIASTLLLVPGVPATNAQTDIMEGFPTVGSARAVSVAMIMVFATLGIWGAEAVMGMLP